MRYILVLAAALVLCTGTAVPAFADAVNTPAPTAPATPDEDKLDKGDTAWMLVSTGLVLFMVPGLALFYGGMVRRKNVLGTMMHSMVCLALIGTQWLLFGYSLAFGATRGGWIGWDPNLVGLQGILDSGRCFPGTHIPIFVHCMYQGMFAIITPALISGAVAERIRFGPYCLFILLWATLVYDPLAHWVWAVNWNKDAAPAGLLGAMGALDFAGGTVVHIAAGLSGLAAILVLRKRLGYPEHAMHPNSMVLTLLGAGMLWFGWFGFNGGSALASNGQAAAALTASQVAAAAAALSWMFAEWFHRGKPTALGLASGLVAGLVAITPASGYVTPLAGLCIGLIAGVVCYVAVCLKPFFKYDDSLDAFGVHGIGGFLGAVLTGFFANAALVKFGSGNDLPPTEGNMARPLVQLFAASVAVVYAFGLTLVLVKVIDMTWGFCADPKSEGEGLDRSQHGETGFDLGPELEMAPAAEGPTPRAALVPPNGEKRFSVVVDGVDDGNLMHVWSELCQPSPNVPPEFRTIYPNVTTVQGNRFRFRGGDPDTMRSSLESLFQQHFKNKLQVHVEG